MDPLWFDGEVNTPLGPSLPLEGGAVWLDQVLFERTYVFFFLFLSYRLLPLLHQAPRAKVVERYHHLSLTILCLVIPLLSLSILGVSSILFKYARDAPWLEGVVAEPREIKGIVRFYPKITKFFFTNHLADAEI